jgi:hypothetical protein
MTRSSSAGADSVGRFLRTQRFRNQENTQNLRPYPACVSVICRRMFHWFASARSTSSTYAASSKGSPAIGRPARAFGADDGTPTRAPSAWIILLARFTLTKTRLRRG